MTPRNEKNNMPNQHLHELFVDELKDILGAERQLLKGLKKLASVAQNENLQQAFENHYEQTETHIERLKSIFSTIGLAPRGKKCKAMEGLLKEAEEISDEFEDSPEILDAALIAAAQKVEHYEIASYGCLVTYAKLMEHSEAEELLVATLAEEKDTDLLLTNIAMKEANVNQKA